MAEGRGCPLRLFNEVGILRIVGWLGFVTCGDEFCDQPDDICVMNGLFVACVRCMCVGSDVGKLW